MKVYLVAYSDEESFSIEGAFLSEVRAKEFKDQHNKKELEFWRKELKESSCLTRYKAEDVAQLATISILEVDEEE